MLYVMTFEWQPGLTREQRDGALARRAEWQYPAGFSAEGEYWLGGESPAVVVVFQAESFAPIMEVALAWGDVFRINTLPAVTAAEGLAMGAAALAQRGV
ncbi:DUF3303 domain-containing protein [Streptacidiphilus melanogenes]|uniref:DUF3303 domain-containing protein n=1 Tax=Streptacidiphilus melanogenes TaxID=411235 RepID=UPI0005A8EE1B|nr:DUF3303 family protein [Streptacidiphilus melanogenes]